MKLPFVISLPHCSGRIPKEVRWRIRLTNTEVADAVDVGTREIFGRLPAKRVLCSEWSRLVVDLNRPPDQREAKGPVALVDYHGRLIYRSGAAPDEKEILRRLKTHYEPYHRQLEKAVFMADVKGLLDCHSLQGIAPAEAPDRGRKRKDITLGNNGGPEGKRDPSRGELTCATPFLWFVKEVFEKAGFSVAINVPYAGGFIVTRYGPVLVARGKLALQIEINQNLYLDPETENIIIERVKSIQSGIHEVLGIIGEAL